jgi:carbamoyltransferase
VSNGKLLESGLFKGIWVQPAAGDAGGSVGAALAVEHIHAGTPHTVVRPDAMSGAQLGPACDDHEVNAMIGKYTAVAQKISDLGTLMRTTAGLLAEGRIVGWVQGRMEFGPRALGNRSILGDPRDPAMQRKLNLRIKYRESFRPFAPAVLAEDAERWFDMRGAISPYMLLVRPVRQEHRKLLPNDHASRSVREKLEQVRSTVPAITHVDFSARVQTVHPDTHPRLHALISAFKQLTGTGMLVNTSFNVRGEPIVRSADDAYRCFMHTEMDALVINDHLFLKQEQPHWEKNDGWKEELMLG